MNTAVAAFDPEFPDRSEPGSSLHHDGPLLRLSEIIGAFSYALDLTEGQPPGHCIRGCWIGMNIARALGLHGAQLSDLYYTLLLKDAGCSSNAARLWELYGMVDDGRLDSIAEAFADVIDAKSSFTYGHSQRVGHYANAIAAELDMPLQQRRWLHRAALLHDIGKLGVSNGILDKPGPLDGNEWEAVKRHAQFTEDILSRVRVFSLLAPIAGAHHERLDGKGYPKRLSGSAIPLETRIITVADIFDAITAARPYRGAVPIDQTLAIMEQDRGSAIDGRCLDALKKSAPWLTQPPQ